MGGANRDQSGTSLSVLDVEDAAINRPCLVPVRRLQYCRVGGSHHFSFAAVVGKQEPRLVDNNPPSVS